MTRTSVDRDVQSDDANYVPPWARKRAPTAVDQPASPSSPKTAAATDPLSLAQPARTTPRRMPKGVDGPNIDPPRPQYGGDIAFKELIGRLTREPDGMPEPPPAQMRPKTSRWVGGLTLLFIVVGIAGYGLSIVMSNDRTPLVLPVDAPAKDEGALAPARGNQPVQRAAAPRLIVEDERGYVNEPLRLGISLDGASGSEFLTITGLEASTRLSAGKLAGANSWRLSAFDLGILFAYPPRDYVGRMDAAVDLHTADGRKVASQVIRLEWIEMTPATVTPKQAPAGRPDVSAVPDQAPVQAPASVANVPAVPDRPPVVQAPAMTLKLQPGELAELLRRANDMLKVGEIPAARLVLRRAAEAGNSEAAFLLASTFDPIALRELGVIGFAPDPDQALAWYRKAAALGSGEAERRIERLGQAGSR